MPLRPAATPLERAGLIALQASDRLLFWPRDDVALMREECHGRIEVTHHDGRVAFRPAPVENIEWDGSPFIRLPGGERIHPRHAREVEGRIEVAGWKIPTRGPLPAPHPQKSESEIPELGVRPSEISMLRASKGRPAVWITTRGDIPAGTSAARAAALLPSLVKAGMGTYINLPRLRALIAEGKRFRLSLEGGAEVTVAHGVRATLQAGLGLPQLYWLEPVSDAARTLYAEGLRDWPDELLQTPADVLKANFGDGERRLMANVIWQAWRYHGGGSGNGGSGNGGGGNGASGNGGGGTADNYGRDHRGFWYVPMASVLARAGFLGDGGDVVTIPPDTTVASAVQAEGWLEILQRGGFDPHYALYEHLMGTFVGEYRLFTYRELGFEEPRPDLRGVGKLRPQTVLLAEKITLERGIRAITSAFGCSWIALGGLPSLLSTEFFVEALRRRLKSTAIDLIAYVDFDPSGWIAAHGFAAQLQRYGLTVRRVAFLVTPSRFTDEELRLYAMPLHATTPQIRGKIIDWLRQSGGINGKGLGLHADHLPPERAVKAFGEELQRPATSV